MNNYKLTIQYDGTRYSGWQKQGNTADTIQGKIETVLQKWLKEDIEIHGIRPRGCRRPCPMSGGQFQNICCLIVSTDHDSA